MRGISAATLLVCASATTLRAGKSSGQSLADCIGGLKKPGDRCEIESGRYNINDVPEGVLTVRGKHGTKDAPIVIASASGNPADVVFDGTLPVNCAWKPYKSQAVLRAQKGGAKGQPYVCTVEAHEVNQLFVDQTMQVPARWPNARFDDKTMYMAPEHWAHSTDGGEHNVETGKGKVVDAGACKDPSECCSECNSNDLAKSGINATGAVAVMNFWSNGVGADLIAAHTPGEATMTYHATWCKDQIERRGKCGDGYRALGRYYLEGSLELFDANTEWFFSKDSRQLYLWTDDGKAPRNGTVTYKAQINAFEFYDSSFVTLANMTLFATTLKAYDDAQDASLKSTITTKLTDLTFDSLDFVYPDSSRRMSGDWLAQNVTTVWTEDKKTPTNHVFFGCSWRYADAAAVIVKGNGNRFRSCTWEWNSWTSLCTANPGLLDGNCGTFAPSGDPPADGSPLMDRLTFRFNGPSKCIRPSGSGLVTRMHFEGQLQLASDGCFVESGGPKSAHLRYNWAFGSGKSALRFDGDDASGTANGEMSYNVGWNVSNFIVKGNNHTFSHNTVFDPADIGAGLANHTFPSLQTPDSDLDRASLGSSLSVENPGATTDKANRDSTFDHNLLEAVKTWKSYNASAKSPPFAGTWTNNIVRSSDPYSYDSLQYFEIKSELRWPWGRDFRPCPGSNTAKTGAGAYPTYSAKDKEHWIPGALQKDPSMPSPSDGEGDAIVDADLIFLPAIRAVSHRVLFGQEGKLEEVATLTGEQNVAQTPAKSSGAKYQWRVDSKFADGSTRTGPTWTFTTGTKKACPAPGPIPPPPAPISAKCETELDACCSDVKGQQDKCAHHVARHNKDLTDCTEEMENRYCGLPPPAN